MAKKRHDQSDINDVSLINILDNIPGTVYLKNTQGQYLYCNKELANILHLSNGKEIIGKTDYEIHSANIAKTIIKRDKRVLATGVAITIEEKGINVLEQHAIYLTKKIPLRDSNGSVTSLLGISIDVTTKKQAEQKVIETYQQNELTLENIISYMPGNVYWINKKGICMGCNDNQLRTLGLRTRDEFVGRLYTDVLKDGSALAVKLANEEVMRSGRPFSKEEEGLNEHGNKAIYYTNKVPLRSRKGDVIGLVGISVDITERKQLEEKLAAALKDANAENEAKDAFLENMRYDV
ncbi:MAG: PAS domain-containing protein, partial [Gammaproteobacteria bacterium]